MGFLFMMSCSKRAGVAWFLIEDKISADYTATLRTAMQSSYFV